ncbi:hypothetical protein [Streptacidiphilus anmyonensis]|uniref:hypothetical protein n=1 Tax=Streptacidiphilus anmyonensis TaxID=405782 RepID=UPI000B2D3FEC|nr:hypothetical protein [Streptacidiphilus anmyonensis]
MQVQALVDLVFAAGVWALLARIRVFGRRRPLLAVVVAALFAVPAVLWVVGAVLYTPA